MKSNSGKFREIDLTENMPNFFRIRLKVLMTRHPAVKHQGAKSKSWEITVMCRVKNKIFYEEKEKIRYQDFEQWTFSLRNEIGMKYGP